MCLSLGDFSHLEEKCNKVVHTEKHVHDISIISYTVSTSFRSLSSPADLYYQLFII